MKTPLEQARALLGVQEVQGPLSNPTVDAMFRDVGHPRYKDDTPWCAAFIGAIHERADIPSTRKLTARSYEHWGTPVSIQDIQPGDVLVTPRGTQSWQGHVEIADGYPEGGYVMAIGGNESNAVRRNRTNLARVIAARRAPGAEPTGAQTALVRGTSQKRFEASLERAKISEGGYVDHPDDRGGPTNHGITMATLREWRKATVTREDVKSLTWPEAARIYKANYWDAVRGDELPVGVDYIVFDMAINHGPRRAVTILQEAIGAVPDGIFGPATLRKVREIDTSQEAVAGIRDIAAIRNEFYDRIIDRDPSQRVFEAGWNNRSTRVESEALSDVSTPSVPPQPSTPSSPSQGGSQPPSGNEGAQPTGGSPLMALIRALMETISKLTKKG